MVVMSAEFHQWDFSGIETLRRQMCLVPFTRNLFESNRFLTKPYAFQIVMRSPYY